MTWRTTLLASLMSALALLTTDSSLRETLASFLALLDVRLAWRVRRRAAKTWKRAFMTLTRLTLRSLTSRSHWMMPVAGLAMTAAMTEASTLWMSVVTGEELATGADFLSSVTTLVAAVTDLAATFLSSCLISELVLLTMALIFFSFLTTAASVFAVLGASLSLVICFLRVVTSACFSALRVWILVTAFFTSLASFLASDLADLARSLRSIFLPTTCWSFFSTLSWTFFLNSFLASAHLGFMQPLWCAMNSATLRATMRRIIERRLAQTLEAQPHPPTAWHLDCSLILARRCLRARARAAARALAAASACAAALAAARARASALARA
mmetsp:Transcript_14571/g.34037  ORF Transcript_14571/g.34037 Transcript_14571/m.34037 type:complete len:327 (+) Transcript_14571:534-1514(+)